MQTTTPPSTLSTRPLTRQERAGAPRSGHETAFNITIWLLFTALWVAFLAAVVFGQASLDNTWHSIRDLPLVIQGVIWLLFLPLTAGLAIWEITWPLVVRLVLIAGLAWVNVYLLFPWRKEA